MAEKVDILIIGGGLTGAALMLALGGKRYNTLLVEANSFSDKANPDFDARTLALSPASVCILKNLGVWSLLESKATPINSIHVSEQRRFGMAHLKQDSADALGYVIEMHHINHALHTLVDHKNILAPAQLIDFSKELNQATIKKDEKEQIIKPMLVVAADGAHSSMRRFSGLKAETKNYNQQAIIANIGLSRSHNNCAYERFTNSGPLAMLPMSENRSSLVWALKPAEASRLLAMTDDDFLKNLQITFGYRLGRFNKVGKRFVYPLQQIIMPKHVAWPLVFVGNAAHTLHPVAGQGFNLGLRDVATLAQCILQYGLNETALAHYQPMRQYDQKAIVRLTDGLVEAFTSRMPGLGILRGLGLAAVDNSPTLRKILTHHARGFAGVVPDLVCGIHPDVGGSDGTII